MFFGKLQSFLSKHIPLPGLPPALGRTFLYWRSPTQSNTECSSYVLKVWKKLRVDLGFDLG